MSVYTETDVMYQLCKEPSAEKPHAGICGGRVSQGIRLPDMLLPSICGFSCISEWFQIREALI